MATIANLMSKAAGLGTLAGGLALAACSAPPPIGGTGGSGGGPGGSCPATTRPTATYNSGWATNPAFNGFAITYPNDGQSFGGIVIVTGFIAGVSSMASWGPFLASKGIAAFLIDPPTPLDDPSTRSRAQLAALQTLKAEATRPGGPLNGKLDLNNLAIAGWSMGGGGTLHSANTNPPGVKAAIAFAPWELGGSAVFPADHVPTLILAGGSADALVNHGMSRGEYDSIPSGVSKAYIEISGADHFQWTSPGGASGLAGTYTWAWLNAYVNGATECKGAIQRIPQDADFASSSL